MSGLGQFGSESIYLSKILWYMFCIGRCLCILVFYRRIMHEWQTGSLGLGID